MKKTAFFFLFIFCCGTALAAAVTPQDIEGHEYESSIKYVYNREIVQGYPDGTYMPDKTLNRAELLKIVVESRYDESDFNSFEGQSCFNDIAGDEWYAKYVCFGKDAGIIEGNPDNTFLPVNEVNFVEALKIMMLGIGIRVDDTSSDVWYMPYYEAAEDHYLVLDELTNQYTHDFSRAQAAEVITRILSIDAAVVQPAVFSTGGGYEPGNIYLGYAQWADVVDLFLVADSGISNYTLEGQVIFFIQGNEVLSFDPNGSMVNEFDSSSVMVEGPFTLSTSQVIHIGTAYLGTTNPVTVLSDVI